MQFSRVFALLMTLVSGATVLEAIGLPRQQNASLVAKRDTGEAESCYLSEYGLHSISGYTIDIDDCDAIVSTAQALESTGVSYYWSLNAGEKGWHLARYRTCQLSVDTVSASTSTWMGSIDVATVVDLALQYDIGTSGGVNSTGGQENCNSTTAYTGYGDPENVIQWYVLYWGGDETEPEFFDQIDQDHVS